MFRPDEWLLRLEIYQIVNVKYFPILVNRAADKGVALVHLYLVPASIVQQGGLGSRMKEPGQEGWQGPFTGTDPLY